MTEPPDPWPQFDTSGLADERMPNSADVLAEIQAHEKTLREQHGERITRITLSPAIAAWFKSLVPAGDPATLPPWGGLPGIPVVEDPRLLPGALNIHRGDTVEHWIAVPPSNPKQLVRIEEPAFPFPWSPR